MKGSGKPMAALVCGRILAFAGTFLTPVVLARVFDLTEFGTYKQFFLLWSTLYALAQFGMAESLFYFVPRAPARAGSYAANAVVFLSAAGLLGLGLVGAGGKTLAFWLGNPELAPYTRLIGLFLALTLASAVLEIVMITRGQYLRAAITYGVSDVVRAACFIIPALATRRLEWLFAGAVLFASLRLGVGLAYLGREFAGTFRPDLPALRDQLAYVVPFGCAVVVDVLQVNFHQFAVSHFFGAAAFAIYAVGCLNIPLVDLVAGSASNVMMVRMSEAIGEGRQADVLALWHDTTRKLALVLVPLVVFVLVTGHDLIVLLFTETYQGSVPVFLICSTGILWTTFNTDGVLRVYADTRFILALSALRLVLNIVLLAFLLGALQAPGAALATVLAAAAAKVVALARVRRLLGVGWGPLLPWRSLAESSGVAVAAALPVLFLKTQTGIGLFPLLLGSGLLYGLALVGLLLRFDLLSDDEKLAFSGWFRRAGQEARQAVGLARG